MVMEQRMDSGMETAMMRVERQLPRKIRIIIAVRHAAMRRLANHAFDCAADEDRLIGERIDLQLRAATGP